MKAFVAAVVAIIVISVGAHYALDNMGFSSQDTYTMKDVRLGN